MKKEASNKTVIFQKPNGPLIVWLAALVLSKIFTEGYWYSFFSVVSYGALFTWAWLEIFYGHNYFRRTLGVVILCFAVLSRA